MEGCGLSVPPLPPRDSSLPVEQQWEVARVYWEMVVEVWESRARQEGIFQESAGKLYTLPQSGKRLLFMHMIYYTGGKESWRQSEQKNGAI